MDSLELRSGQVVLLLWAGQQGGSNNIEEVVKSLSEQVGPTGRVQVEHVDRLKQCTWFYF